MRIPPVVEKLTVEGGLLLCSPTGRVRQRRPLPNSREARRRDNGSIELAEQPPVSGIPVLLFRKYNLERMQAPVKQSRIRFDERFAQPAAFEVLLYRKMADRHAPSSRVISHTLNVTECFTPASPGHIVDNPDIPDWVPRQLYAGLMRPPVKFCKPQFSVGDEGTRTCRQGTGNGLLIFWRNRFRHDGIGGKQGQ